MSVNLPNSGIYQQQLGQHCTAFRDALNALKQDATYINGNGGAALLESLGIDPSDAQQIVSVVGAITDANSVVVQVETFIQSTVFLWGGQ
jgi:hypothetical protein